MRTSELRKLLDRLRLREDQISFDTILRIIRRLRTNGPLLAITKHKQLVGSQARLEANGYIVFPFYSFYITSDATNQLSDFAHVEQASLISQFIASENKVISEFVDVYSSSSDASTAKLIHDIIHQYFIGYELDRRIEKIVFRLMWEVAQKRSSEAAENVYERYSALFEVIEGFKNIQFTLVSVSDKGQLHIQKTTSSNAQDYILEQIKAIIPNMESFRQDIVYEIRYDERVIFFHLIPLRFRHDWKLCDLIILSSVNQPIPVFCSKIVSNFVKKSSEQLIENIRTGFERTIQNLIIEANSTKDTKPNAFDDFCRFVVERIGPMTSSHSVTIRTYCAFTNSLVLSAHWSGNNDVEPPRETIYCDPSGSVNAFCYTNEQNPAYIYIPNIGDIPIDYQSAGLKNTIVARALSKAEICLPIGPFPLRLGTLNLESPYYAAYELDISFLQSISFHIFEYWRVINSSGDAWWLSQLSLTHLATHELRDFKESLAPEKRKQLENIIYTISPSEFYSKNMKFNWGHFLKFIQRLHKRSARHDPESLFDRVWRVDNIDATQPLGSRFLGSLRLILECVVNNAKKHSEYSLNNIEICLSSPGKGRVITIIYRSNINYIDPQTLEEIERRFVTPALSADGWHFGLFLVGVHARLLGGDIEIDPVCKKSFNYGPFAYMVRIPLAEDGNVKDRPLRR